MNAESTEASEKKGKRDQKEKRKVVNLVERPGRTKKLKVFLVSATLTKQFAGNKHKTQVKKNKNNKKQRGHDQDNKGKPKKDENMAPKLKALLERIKFSGKPKIIDLTENILIPEKLHEYKTICTEEDKML